MGIHIAKYYNVYLILHLLMRESLLIIKLCFMISGGQRQEETAILSLTKEKQFTVGGTNHGGGVPVCHGA